MAGGILKAIIFLVVLAGIIAAVVAGLVVTDVLDKAEVDNYLTKIGLGSIIEIADPVIVAHEASDGFAGWDYVIDVSCRVRNEGDTGDVVVKAKVSHKTGSWEEERVVHIPEGEEEEVTIRFTQPTISQDIIMAILTQGASLLQLLGSDRFDYDVSVDVP